MLFCSKCGGSLTNTQVLGDTRPRRVCSACGAVTYQNPKILASLMVECDGALLLCQRRSEPSTGKWAPPAGFMEMGETVEEAAARETAEETGVVIDPAALDLHIVTTLEWTSEVYVGFRAVVRTPAVSPSAEVLDARFFAEHEIPWDALAFPETAGYLRLYFQERRNGKFGIHLARIGEGGSRRRQYSIDAINDSVQALAKARQS